jgi:hypothetical protein
MPCCLSYSKCSRKHLYPSPVISQHLTHCCTLPAEEDGEEGGAWDDEDLLEAAAGGELGPRVSADLARTIRSGGAADDAELQELMTALQVGVEADQGWWLSILWRQLSRFNHHGRTCAAGPC